MSNFYFAETCLAISDDSEFINDVLPSNFRNETAYSTKIILNTLEKCPDFSDAEHIISDSGICVSDIGGEKWLFSSTGKNNRCYIEASRDCSELRYYIDAEESANSRIQKENFKHLLRTASECRLAYSDGISLHASCVVYDGQAVLFTAPSGTGKSTQARIWNEHLDARIINGDRPFLHIFSDEIRAYGVPWDGKEQIFLQENYPVKAIVELRQAKENSIYRLDSVRAFNLMMNQCFVPMWDDTAKFSVLYSARLTAKRIPFYRLYCLPHESAADLLYNVLFENNYALVKEELPETKIREALIKKVRLSGI